MTEQQPIVSVIVPTYNSSKVLEACLVSIKNQTYKNIELVVVDNNSKDETLAIASNHTDKTFSKGPERSAQRNYGVTQSTGEYILIIDSDMELKPEVVEQCVTQFQTNPTYTGLVIPEESFGTGFWAQCKKLERSFYVGVSWIEAARAFPKTTYMQLGGYDEDMVSGEDWDLSQRAAALGQLGRVGAYIMHNEGHLKLATTLKKKYYYAQKFAAYTSKNKTNQNISAQTGPLTRYKLFFAQPGRLFKNPATGLGMLFMKTAEFTCAAYGLITSKAHKI